MQARTVFNRISGAGTVAARLPTRHRHWRRVDPHAAADKPEQTSGSDPTSPPLPSYTGSEEQHHLQRRKRRNPVGFSFCSWSRIYFFLLCFGSAFSLWIFFLLVSPSSLLSVADLAVAKGVAAVVTELLSSVRLALLLIEMKRSGEDRLLKGFAEGGLLAVQFCRLLKLGERLEEGCLLLPLCSGHRWRSVEG